MPNDRLALISYYNQEMSFVATRQLQLHGRLSTMFKRVKSLKDKCVLIADKSNYVLKSGHLLRSKYNVQMGHLFCNGGSISYLAVAESR